MDGGDGDNAEDAWKTKIAQQTKNKLDEEDRKDSPKRRKLSNEGLLDIEGKMDEKISGMISAQTMGDQAFINQLQEEIQTKDLAVQALQFENQKLKQQQQASPQNVSTPMEKKLVDQYRLKITEYQTALVQRDQVIGTLQTRLAELVQQRDEVVTEAAQQTENFGQEVETLKLQLQEATDALSKKWATGVNPREHLLLKNKLIAIQQNIEQDRQVMEEINRQLSEKSDRCNLLDLKYKQCLHKCKQMQLENEDLKNKNKIKDANIEQLEGDNKKQEEKFEDELQEAREKVSLLTQEQQQTSSEIHVLMRKLQELTNELQITKEEHERQLVVADERLGNEITLIKQKISEQHAEEISKLKKVHENELAQVQQQIDAFEKLQKEDHAKLLENLEAERNKAVLLESSLQEVTDKQIQDLQNEQERRLKLEERLNSELERIKDLIAKNGALTKEIEDKNGLIDTMSSELTQSKSSKEDLNLQIQNVQQQCSEATEILNKSHEEHQNLKVRYEELLIEKENWLKERTSLTAEIQNIEKLSAEVMKLEAEVKMKMQIEEELLISQNIQGDLKRRCAELESCEAEKLNLQEELEKQNLEITKLKQEYDKISILSNELTQTKADKDDLNNQIQVIQQNYSSSTEKLDEMNNKCKSLELKCEELQLEKDNWLEEKETLKNEVSNFSRLNEEVLKLQEEMKMKLELEQELMKLKDTHMHIQKRCTELENYEKLNQDLTKDLEKKGLEFAELHKKYLSLQKEYELLEEADWLDDEMLQESGESLPLKTKINELVLKMREADRNLHSMEIVLKDVKVDKESLLSEMDQLRKTCDSMEKQKNECEGELEKMMDQYKMMEAELVSTRLALDREVQLATHQRLTSDVGASVSASLEDHAAQTTSVSSGTYPLMDDESSEHGGTETPIFSPDEKQSKFEDEKDGGTWKEKYISLEKSKKECDNEMEKIKIKMHDQYFAIQSLENMKSKLSRRIEELEAEKKSLREDQTQLQKFQADNIEHQVIVRELKLQISKIEEKLRQAEEEKNKLKMNVQNLVKLHSSECPELSQNIMKCLESTKVTMPKKKVTSSIKVKYDIEIEELHIVYEDYRKCLSNLQNVLHHSDKLNKEKLDSHLENVELRNEIQKLKTSPEVKDKESRSKEKTEPVESKIKELPESISSEKADVILRHENERLKIAMNQQQIRSRLESLQQQSPKLQHHEEESLAAKQKLILPVHLGPQLQQILQDWEQKAKSEPALAEFITSESYKVHTIIENLDEFMIDSPSSQVYMETAIKFLRDAVVKTVSHQYIHLVEEVVKRLEDNIAESLEQIFPKDVAQILDIKPPSNSSGASESDSNQQLSNWDDLAGKVESLIKARTTLTEAANEFEEKLRGTLTVELSSLTTELEKMVKNVTLEEKAVSQLTSKVEVADEQFIQEFMEIAKRQFEGDQAEKMQLLQNQKMMVNKILEDNKAKLHSLCSEHISKLDNVASLPDAVQLANILVNSLENTLSVEVSWVEQQYKELLEQYTYEQNLVKQTFLQTLNELVFRLETLLQENNAQQIEPSGESLYAVEMRKMSEDHAAEVARLESQLAARDNETLRHLQSLYSDRDWYKKTVGLLSHVTLQLLHYYSVAENYTHKSYTTPAQHDSMQYHEMTSGKVLDLSFLSDCVPDEGEANQYTVFPEDSAMSTGLIGKTVDPDHCEETELASNAESMLDSTAMSEGMLDDMDKDEQVRQILTKSYPQLMSILKGRWDRVMVDNLEKEVQELTISLQASAGMLKIFMHSVTEGHDHDLSSHTIRDESKVDSAKENSLDLSQHHIDGSDLTANFVQLTANEDETIGDLSKDTSQALTNIENTEQLSKLQLTSHFSPKGLEDLSQSLTQLLCHEESFLNLTKLKPQDIGDEEKLKLAIVQLCRNAEAADNLQLKLHHLDGLLKGSEQQKSELEEEIEHLNHCNKNLAIELQTAKDQLEEFELGQQNKSGTSTTQYAAKMEASKDIKERVRAVLSAKNKSKMNHTELVSRVGDLEGILDTLARESDAAVEKLKGQVSDLSQQLEVADRQLRSSRQFLEEHASERDQEVEELIQAREKLQTQLREKDAVIAQHANLEKEVESLERELREKSQELQDALALKEDLLAENKTAVDKLQVIEERLDKTTRGLEALQLSVSSASQSDEDLSIKDQLEVPSLQELEDNRALSPATLDRRLEEKLMMLERTTEAAVKRTRDLEMTVKNLRLDLDEAVMERDALQERSSEQLVQISSLEARLDELRRSDHPMAAEMRQRLTLVQEQLELKRNELAIKGRELEELKFNHGNLRGKLLSREEELERLMSASQPHSLPQSSAEQLLARHQQLEEELKSKMELIEKLKNELSEASKGSAMPAALSYHLIDEKNAEIDNLAQLLQDIKVKVKDIGLWLSQGGNVQEAVNMLKKIGGGEKFLDTLGHADHTHSMEVLRRDSEVSSRLTPVTASTVKDDSPPFALPIVEEDAMTTQSSKDLSFMSNQPDVLKVPDELAQEALSASTELKQVLDEVIEGADRDTSDSHSEILETSKISVAISSGIGQSDLSESTQEGIESRDGITSSPTQLTSEEIKLTKEEFESLCSASDEVSVLRIQIDLLQKEITSLNDYQKKLEEDYRLAQDLLEAREAEITQLSEEIEDVVPQPLPSEAMQLQDRCFRLEEQLLEMQGKLENIEGDYEEEKKCHQESDEKLMESEKERTRLQDGIKESTERAKTMEMELRKLKLNLEEMTDQMQQMKQKYAEQTVVLHCKEEELIKVNAQMGQIQVEMNEKLSYANRELTKVEQQYQKEILDVKEEKIVREKQLCSDYEERMADQVSDLTKLVREKEEIISKIRHCYEAELKEVVMQKDQALRKVNEWREKLRVEEAGEQSRDISRLCDSLEELKAGVAQEVNKSDQLDTSLVTYLKHGQERQNAGRSNRASSAFSDLSEGDEAGDVANKVQKLMRKVYEEGVQVLTLIELMYLQKHQTHLDSSQRSLISQTGLLGIDSADNSSVVSREVSPKTGPSGIDTLANRERTQLLRRMASLEEELSKKEREIKEKVDQLEFRLEQEKIAADELKLNNEAEKRRMEKLSEQLHQERLLGADQISEITFLRSQHTALQIQLQKVQEERNDLRESLDNIQKQIETLRADLQAERTNFSSVSKVLNQQRRLSSTTKNQQNQVIKDLRDTLEREREKILTLRTQLSEAMNKQSSGKPNTSRSLGRNRNSDFVDANIRSSQEDIKVQLVIEQERVAELQRSYDKEVMKVLNLSEQLRIERASSKALMMEEQGKSAEFTKHIRNLEGEKDKLKRQMARDHDKIQHQESRIRELEGDIAKLESELRAQAAAHEMASHRVREGDAQMHMSYTSVLNKLGEAETEVCSLRLKNNLLAKDLELAREKEVQLQQELTTEKMAINRLGLPALAKINNLNEYFELQLKENVELCKSVLRLTDNRHSARMKIVSLEATITDLTEQLIKAKAAAQPSPTPERILQNERSIWETERSALQSLISRKDAELMRLRRDAESRLSNQNFCMPGDDSKVQYIFGKYLRSESWRKALVYQKKYLLVVLQGYEATEQNTYSRLNVMTQRVYGPMNSLSRPSLPTTPRNHRFRVRALVVIACCRMKFMVQRWKRSRRLGSQVLLPNPPSSIPPTPEPTHGSRPESAASGPGPSQDELRMPFTSNRPSASAAFSTITGHTPPTKETSNYPSLQHHGMSATRRSLFLEQESSNLDEYIERLGNIHSRLGLTPKNT